MLITSLLRRSDWRGLYAPESAPREVMNEKPRLQGWDRFIGRWETEGAHPMLPGEAIRGTSTFEWLDGRRFVIWRSHYDHSEIPDAITIIGVTDGELSMHYFDHRGVYRVYAAADASRQYRHMACSASPALSATTATGSRVEVSYRGTGRPGRTILISTIRGCREPKRDGRPWRPRRAPRARVYATRFNACPRFCSSCTQARIGFEWLMTVPSRSLIVGNFLVPVA
jgi:hypothetical protein